MRRGRSGAYVVAGKKALSLVSVVAAVSMLTFGLMSVVPGDQANALLGTQGTAQTRAELRRELGLDRPLPVRYLKWAASALRGDLGVSFRTHESVTSMVAARLPVTIELLIVSQVVALAVGVPLAVWSAHRRGRSFDRAVTAGTFAVLSAPSFVLALVLIYVFSYRLRLLPSSGFVPLASNVWANAQSIILPAVSLAAAPCAIYTRLLRTEVLLTLDQDFIVVARAKGLSHLRVLYRHALRPSSLSLITVIGLTLGGMLGGALVIEVIFGLPGLGTLLYSGILNRDYVVIQGVVLVIAVAYVLINLLVDLSYSLLDPRVRRG